MRLLVVVVDVDYDEGTVYQVDVANHSLTEVGGELRVDLLLERSGQLVYVDVAAMVSLSLLNLAHQVSGVLVEGHR